MRILHLIDSGGVYGAERILLYLAREQRRSGHHPVIGSIARPGAGPVALEIAAISWGLPVAPIRIGRIPTPGVINEVLGQVHHVGPDVVHSHGYKANILIGPLSRGRRGPMLATLHGWTSARRLSAIRLYERLDQWALRRIDSVVVVSPTMLRLPALRRVSPARRHLIENGIPDLQERLADLTTANAQPLPEDLLRRVSARPTLVSIGRLSPEKGFGLLIEAFGQARAKLGAGHQLIIVGEGPERTMLTERIAALGLGNDVHLVGFLDGADRLLRDAAGFVMSSFTEGMPLVLLEALQWGVPILATSVGAIPEMLDNGSLGALVPPNDLEALRAGLERLMTDPGVRAKPAQNDRYTSGRMAAEYLRAYEAIT